MSTGPIEMVHARDERAPPPPTKPWWKEALGWIAGITGVALVVGLVVSGKKSESTSVAPGPTSLPPIPPPPPSSMRPRFSSWWKKATALTTLLGVSVAAFVGKKPSTKTIEPPKDPAPIADVLGEVPTPPKDAPRVVQTPEGERKLRPPAAEATPDPEVARPAAMAEEPKPKTTVRRTPGTGPSRAGLARSLVTPARTIEQAIVLPPTGNFSITNLERDLAAFASVPADRTIGDRDGDSGKFYTAVANILKRHEGFRATRYLDPPKNRQGKYAIGYGFHMPKGDPLKQRILRDVIEASGEEYPEGMYEGLRRGKYDVTEEGAETLLYTMVVGTKNYKGLEKVIIDFVGEDAYQTLGYPQQAALIDIIYRSGDAHFRNPAFIQAIQHGAETGDYSQLSDAIQHGYTGSERGIRDRMKYVSALASEGKGKVIGVYYHIDAKGKGGYYDKEGREINVAALLNVPEGALNSPFGNRMHPMKRRILPHAGVDIDLDYGEAVLAAADGTVTFSGSDGGYGNKIEIEHFNGKVSTVYAHLSAFGRGIRQGATVRQGQEIGKVGSSGYVTGPHLHYEVRIRGRAIDPKNPRIYTGETLPLAEKIRLELTIKPPTHGVGIADD